MDEGWKRVGAAVRDARERQGLTQKELAAVIDASEGTVRAIERGTSFAKVTPTLRSVERNFGWVQGSIEAIRAGGEPTMIQAAPGAGLAAINIEGLPVRVTQALAEGANLDARVVPLTRDADMVVIIKGKAAAGPEEIRAALLEWERREGHLDRLADLADGPSENS